MCCGTGIIGALLVSFEEFAAVPRIPDKYRVVLAFAAGWAAATLFAAGAVRVISGAEAIASSAVIMVLFLVAGVAYARFAKEPTAAPSPEEGKPASLTLDQRCEAYAREHALTPRQSDVLRLLAEGMQVADIAEELYLSKDTVKSHTKAIYAKADVHSRQELVAAVYALGE